MADAPVPSLSEDGWITDPLKKADQLLAHFLSSDYSQTAIYLGRVASFSAVIQETQDDFTKFMQALETVLQSYYSAYFTSVQVEVLDVTKASTPSKGEISIYVGFTADDGQSYTLAKSIELLDSKANKIINISNYGG